MSRPRKLTLPISDLKCFKTLKSELQSLPELENYDFDNGILVFKEKYSYKVRPKNIQKAIDRLSYYARRSKEQEVFTRQDFCNLLGISRPTLRKWINEDIIFMEIIPHYQRNKQTFLFDATVARSIVSDLNDYLILTVKGGELK